MSDIDDKLQEILANIPYDHQVTFEAYDEAIAQIKQAFADEGYISPEADSRKRSAQLDLLKSLAASVEKLEAHLLAPSYYGADGVIRMTGAEWYSRFEKEYVLPQVTLTGTNESDRVLAAARKAANL